MRSPEPCTHRGGVRHDAIDALYSEVARIRELAEQQRQDQETIERLTREVQMLREIVARTRGMSHRGVPRPQVPTPLNTSAA
jgi:hypothetical protein